MDAPFTEAAVWVANTVQSDLAGYDFVQWPSQGQRMLLPRKRDDGPVWIDPHTDDTVAAVGELCQHIDR